MKLYDPITGKWSDYIAGGIISGGYAPELTPEEKLRNKEYITAMVRDFIKRNPDKKDEILKECGDIISL